MSKRALVLLLALAGLGGDVARASQPLSAQGPYSASLNAYIDPTVSTFNSSHPAVACSSACSGALVNQNTDALQAAVNLSASTKQCIRLPPAEYPFFRGGVSHNQRYGLLISNLSGVCFDSPGAVLRLSGDAGLGDLYGVQVSDGSSHVRFLPGLIWSLRDVTNGSEHSHDIELGFGTPIDDVQIRGETFIEQVLVGRAGDCVNLAGGVDATHLVTRVSIVGNYFQCHRSGVGFQHGTAFIDIVGNWFGSTITDQAIDHEPTSAGGNAYENDVGNLILRSGYVNIVFSMSGTDQSPACGNVVAYNLLAQGTINAGNLCRCWFLGNQIMVDQDVNADADIELFRTVEDVWVDDNYLRRGYVSQGGLLSIAQNNSIAPQGAWIMRNRFQQMAGGGVTFTAVAKANLLDTDWFTLSDGVLSKDYEFDTLGDGCTGGRVCINVSTDVTIADVGTRMAGVIAATQVAFTVFDSTTGNVTCSVGQATITATEHVVNSGFLAALNGVAPAVELDGDANAWVGQNQITYQGLTPDSGGAGGFLGILARSQLQAVSGWYFENQILRGLQPNSSQAGRMLTGVDFSADTYNHTGHAVIRDNLVNGARQTFLMTQINQDEGSPVISGNVGLNVVNDSTPTLYLTESTQDADPTVVASGAILPSTGATYVSAAGAGTMHSLAAGVRAGKEKFVRWTSVAGGADDTLTIANFGDGTSVSTTTNGAWIWLVWDGSTWWSLDRSNVTVNP